MTSTQSPVHSSGTEHRLLLHPGDLAGHVGDVGPLNVPAGKNDAWCGQLADRLAASGLAGRGGGGFPASRKLALARSAGAGGTVVVNAMEGEPASDKDKLLLTRVPHLVLDGAQYLGALCQAESIAVCVPAGRNGVASVVGHAIADRVKHRYAPLPEEIVRPPDRFIAGEESALANWFDSGSSLPLFRPNKGIALRLGRRPALIHNTETLAHLALIARFGPEPFRRQGRPDAPGTCLVTISGQVAQPGVVEVELGTPLWDIAVRANPTSPVQALLVGGYGGRWVGAEHFGVPYAPEPLRAVGALAGVGVIVVLGSESCGVAESARIAQYLAAEGAGQCGPCVYGLPAIADDLSRLAGGRVDAELVTRLTRRLGEVSGRGACRHPDGVAGMVQSALTVFGTDVAAHARGRPCANLRRPTVLRFPRSFGS